MTEAVQDYVIALTVEEACAYLTKAKNPRIIAGGTDLLIDIHKGKQNPDLLLDVTRIPALNTITCTREHLIIGCAVPFGEIALHPAVRQHLAALSEACTLVGSPQIRNKGTLGGNLGTGSAAADAVCPLTAFEPLVQIYDGKDSRQITVAELWQKDFFSLIGRQVLLESLIFPLSAATRKSVFVKLGRRQALAISRLNLTVAIEGDSAGVISQAKVAIGSAGRHPYRIAACEEILLGKKYDRIEHEAFAAAAAKAVREALGARATAPYKIAAMKALACHALERLDSIQR